VLLQDHGPQEEMKETEPLPQKGSSRSISLHFVQAKGLYSLLYKGHHWAGLWA